MKTQLFKALLCSVIFILPFPALSQNLVFSTQIQSAVFTDDVYSRTRDESGETTFKLSYGFTYAWLLSKQYGLDVGLYLSNNGQKRLNNNNNTYRNYQLSYLTFPVRPYYEIPSKNPDIVSRVSFGPQLNFLVHSKITEFKDYPGRPLNEKEIDLPNEVLGAVIDFALKYGASFKLGTQTWFYAGINLERSVTSPLSKTKIVYSFFGETDTQTLSSKYFNAGIEFGFSW